MLLSAVVLMAIMGAAFGIILGVAGRKFHVEVDPRVAEIRGCLPGANCGGCGFPGCDGFAEAVVAGKAAPNACKAGGPSVSDRIGEVLGVSVGGAGERQIARVLCGGGGSCGNRAVYSGIQSCRAAILAGGGFRTCEYACLGLGDCVAACPFGAISMGPAGMPLIDEAKCVGCGNCVKACPRGIIEIIPESKMVFVSCVSTAAGPITRKICKVGCIACKLCAKNCPSEAIVVENNLARIDYSKCTVCGICASKCPTKAISDLRGAEEKRVAS